ncbi:MAG: hypothetical protein ACK5PR_00975 [bacterium]|jgi:hypothetical protein
MEITTAVITVVTSLVTIASVVANFTKTDADNKVVAKVSRFVNLLALNFRK